LPQAAVHYFSGTGNTARAAELIAAGLRSAGYTVALHCITSASLQSTIHNLQSEMSLVVFAFPIYACGIPTLFSRFLRRSVSVRVCPCPSVPRPRAAVVCTMGDIISYDKRGRRHHVPGFEGHALMQASGILKRRGFDVFLTGACSYPLNWTQAVSAPRPAIDAELRALGDSQATEIGKRIAAGERSIRRFSPAHTLWSVPFDLLFRIFGRRGMAKLYVADERCNRCGLCVSQCPVHAVRLVRGRPRWSYNCESCQRCINICPKQAIQTSWPRLIAETVLTFIPVPFLVWRLGPHPWIPVRPILIEVLLWIGVYAAVTWLLDVLLFLLELIPGVRRLFHWNLTRSFRRYLEPHFRPPAAE
jgi:NAD-dependent dihydropyrimidine dehydrogenase PreA subunit